jgi:hypothetical protein
MITNSNRSSSKFRTFMSFPQTLLQFQSTLLWCPWLLLATSNLLSTNNLIFIVGNIQPILNHKETHFAGQLFSDCYTLSNQNSYMFLLHKVPLAHFKTRHFVSSLLYVLTPKPNTRMTDIPQIKWRNNMKRSARKALEGELFLVTNHLDLMY